ncbi:UvrD-helicase domain-containing protein [Kiritimatiella glycovorans]|uniref:DNA 3'-5' helicase n=1 Tax=Kiritimatiella glycovorans TaxID=1307763 RepID=A0A0G3EN54_9BACT|nr:UvrD-helicase domain-containing protein [Kiritimatiella glycovorans]AKJ65584.1 ATP-dependent helicase/nuclease subunit A [Kiritimatiella glycovorans]
MSPGHRVISASAGAGKTYQLTLRYIALLAAGADPREIVALTFSRKAAGEIFDRIVQRIAGAAADEGERAGLNRELGGERDLGRADLVGFLRAVLRSVPLLRIGTLDSFFVSVLGAFPFEFGLTAPLEILDDERSVLERERLLRRLFAAETAGGGIEALYEDFRDATFGREEKDVLAQLTASFDAGHRVLLDVPDARLWGNAPAIWPQGSDWFRPGDPEIAESCAQANEALAGMKMNAKQREAWTRFLDAAEGYHPAAGFEKKTEDFFAKLLALYPELEQGGPAEITNHRKQELGQDLCPALAAVVRHVMRCQFALRLKVTAGHYGLLRRYEKEYQRSLRRHGRLSFDDLRLLLASGPDPLEREGRPVLSSRGDDGGRRLYIDYRLDGRYRHWLLDEFQDTSIDQWKVLANLADEVFQADEGERTFFYVGDVKQAIYGWRGGDARLFDEVLDHYRDRIEVRALSESWRSSPRIMDAVNGVFGALDRVPGLPARVRERWARHWQPHSSAGPRRSMAGWVELTEIRAGESKPERLRKRAAWVAQRLRHIPPQATRAVLVTRNAAGAEVVETLRAEGIEAVWEGERRITDCPAVTALLSLLQLAEHPGDRFALEHVRMTPLAAACVTRSGSPRGAAREVRAGLSTRGFEHVLREWAGALLEEGRCHRDPFTNRRVGELLEAARRFDAGGGGGVHDFRRFAEAYRASEAADPSAVRVMTIHRAKGLEFDAVFLPDLNDRDMLKDRDGGLAVECDDDLERSPRWVLDLPRRLFVEADPTVGAWQQRRDREGAFEQLCVLYVAMTRAARALYMAVEPPPRSSSTVVFADVLRAALGAADGGGDEQALYRDGDPEWWGDVEEDAGSPSPEFVERLIDSSLPERRAHRLRRRTPSAEDETAGDAGRLFDRGRREAAAYGTLVHRMFEAVEWIDDLDPAAVAARAGAGEASGPAGRAEAALRRCAENASARALLAHPGGTAEVWREYPFEIVHGGEWVSGRFDRVVVRRDGAGAIARVLLVDIKTGATPPEEAAARYGRQLELYAEVLARLTGLPVGRIDRALLLADRGQGVRVGGPESEQE